MSYLSNMKNNLFKVDKRMTSFYDTPKELLHKRKSFDLVPKVRETILKLWEKDKIFTDECDINRIESDDWFVQRFIEYYDNDVDRATNYLVDNLKWRKAFGVNTRSLNKDFAKEFFEIGAIFVYNEDKKGIPLLYSRGKCNRKIPKLVPLFERFFIGIIEQLNIDVGNKGFILVLDCSDCTLNNLSMDLLKFVITSLRVHYPLGIQYIIIYNMPWILRGIWKLVKGWLEDYQDLVQFANGDQIQKYVSVENLPKYMGGKCELSFTKAPDNCPSVYDLAEKYGFTQTEVRKYMKSYEDLLEEAKNYN